MNQPPGRVPGTKELKVMKKITKATFKSFVKKAGLDLLIKVESDFNGMIDCVETIEDAKFEKIRTEEYNEYSLGIVGVWLVGSNRNRFYAYEDNNVIGIKCYNCCGSFIVAIAK